MQEGGASQTDRGDPHRDREELEREKAELNLQLHNTEKEVVRLKGDLRRQEIQLERERERSLLPSGDVSSSDREKVSPRPTSCDCCCMYKLTVFAGWKSRKNHLSQPTEMVILRFE